MGDLRAQVTAVKTGERRFLELISRYGREPVLGAVAAIMDQSEIQARATALLRYYGTSVPPMIQRTAA